MSSLPYIKFFPSDWLSEESLRLVSFGARGLWIDLLCLMAKNERRRGYLEVNGGVNGGVNPTLEQLAKLVASSTMELTPLLDELKAAGTYSVEPETGVLFSRRMVRDFALYSSAVSYGKQGGNPNLTKGLRRRVKAPLNPNTQPSLTITMGSNVSVSEASVDPLRQRAGRLFKRRESTVWDSSENRAWETARAAVKATAEDDWVLLEWFYGLPASVETYRRRDLATMLNNWGAEIDRARDFKARHGNGGGQAPRRDVKPARPMEGEKGFTLHE